MGHTLLGTLPRSQYWQDVVEYLEEGDDLKTVAAASARAAEKALLNASTDPVFAEAVHLLINIPLAARQADFGDALRRLELSVGSNPTLFDVVAAATARLDAVSAGSTRRNDFTELATRALSGSLADCIGGDLPSLFGTTPEEVRASFRKHSYAGGFAALNRDYFGKLVGGSLSYWLDRVLALNVGAGRRFPDVGRKMEFSRALGQHVSEATRIIQEFSSGWVGRKLHDKGSIERVDARDFGHVCLKKIVSELRVGWREDA